MPYSVATLDVCAQGFERLRSESEFILTAYVWAATPPESYLEQWLSDIQSCDRGEGFDYAEAEKTVREYYESDIRPRWTHESSNPFRLDDEPDAGDEGESCVAFLYIEREEAE